MINSPIPQVMGAKTHKCEDLIQAREKPNGDLSMCKNSGMIFPANNQKVLVTCTNVKYH